MDLRFNKDPDTGLPHIHGHGVTEDEVRQVLARPCEVQPGSEDSRIAMGQTEAGRYLRVIYVPDPGGRSAFVITAFELRGKQLKAHRRFKRRRRK
jgi:hypothetical protein